MNRHDMARFFAKVHRVPLTGCWIWTGARSVRGYGYFMSGNKLVQPYRLAYETFVGPIPDGFEIDHVCMNPRCVNPAHLDPVSRLENMRRWVETLTHCRHGHPWDEKNTYAYVRKGSPRRQCRECGRLNTQKYARKSKEAMTA